MIRLIRTIAATLLAIPLLGASLLATRPVAADDPKPKPSRSQYTLFVYETESDFAARVDPKLGKSYWGAFAAFGDELKKAGILVGGQVFEPPTTAASTVTVRDNKPGSARGTFRDGQAQIGGYFTIEAATPEEAARWAARCPGARAGAVEVRLNMDMSRAMMGAR